MKVPLLASLPRIREFAPGDPLRGEPQVGAFADEARTFTAELERDRRQLFGGAFVDMLSGGPAAREENIIELPVQNFVEFEFLVHGDHLSVRKALRNHPAQELRRALRLVGQLQHDPVAGGKGAAGRFQRQQQRIVPGRKHEHLPVRLRQNPAASRKIQPRFRAAPP